MDINFPLKVTFTAIFLLLKCTLFWILLSALKFENAQLLHVYCLASFLSPVISIQKTKDRRQCQCKYAYCFHNSVAYCGMLC